jgi:hypothetical protein
MFLEPKIQNQDKMQVRQQWGASNRAARLLVDEFQSEKHFSRWQSPPIASNRSPLSFSWLEPSTHFVGALSDSLLWIAAATILRLGIDAVMVSFAQFWVPGIILLASPAAIALILAMVFPQASWVLGYRLVLVMFGLLLGGRL